MLRLRPPTLQGLILSCRNFTRWFTRLFPSKWRVEFSWFFCSCFIKSFVVKSKFRNCKIIKRLKYIEHYINPPSIRGFFAPYSPVFGQNTVEYRTKLFCIFFLNNFPVYHCIRTLWIHVTRIPFYSLDMNLRECGKLYHYNSVYKFRYMFWIFE